jgi:hypothetical protein
MVLVAGAVACLAGSSALAQSNLCYNGSFNSPNGALDGWTVDYEWTGNSKYAKNRDTVSALPEFRGRKNVMCLGYTYENKVESKPIKFEPGTRYQCTLEFIGDVPVRFSFNGYMWRPGVAPYDDPHLKDLRRIFKSDAVTGTAKGWRTMTFTFPHPEISELAWSHLKQVRYITAMVLVPALGVEGKGTYISNVKVIKLLQPSKVVKDAKGEKTEGLTGD